MTLGSELSVRIQREGEAPHTADRDEGLILAATGRMVIGVP